MIAIPKFFVYYVNSVLPKVLIFSAALFFSLILRAQEVNVRIDGWKGKIFLSSLAGEKLTPLDSAALDRDNHFVFRMNEGKYQQGLYRLTFSKNWIDFIFDGKDIVISTYINAVADSLKILESESNKLFYSFLKLNKSYKEKSEILRFVLSSYPKDDSYFVYTTERLRELQNEYLEFVNIDAQKNRSPFAAKYIRSAQLPVVDEAVSEKNKMDYLRAHALDNVNFSDASLCRSDLFTSKTIEYLTYFSNPQLPKESLEKEFMKAIDSVLNRAKINQVVYSQVTEYLIDGFKKFGFDLVIDYIVENYVIKDDLCLDVKTEDMIRNRIDQARTLRLGSQLPDFELPDKNGIPIKLSSIKSEKILVIFYLTKCPHCSELLPRINAYVKKNNLENLKVLAVSLDNEKSDWLNFIGENCQSFINLSEQMGGESRVLHDYHIYATPTMFLSDSKLKIIGKPVTFDELLSMLR